MTCPVVSLSLFSCVCRRGSLAWFWFRAVRRKPRRESVESFRYMRVPDLFDLLTVCLACRILHVVGCKVWAFSCVCRFGDAAADVVGLWWCCPCADLFFIPSPRGTAFVSSVFKNELLLFLPFKLGEFVSRVKLSNSKLLGVQLCRTIFEIAATSRCRPPACLT